MYMGTAIILRRALMKSEEWLITGFFIKRKVKYWFQGYRVTGLQGYRVSGFQGFTVSGLQNYRVSGLPD
jgi:hypothetical protein